MKRLIIICLLVLACGCSERNKESQAISSQENDPEYFSTWTEFKPQSKLFKVMLPHSPQYAKDLIPIPGSELKRRYDMYASEKIDGTLFLISVITYPTPLEADSDDLLKLTLDELTRSKSENKLKSVKEALLKSHRSLDFSMVNKDLNVEGKVFMKDNIVYVLSYVTKKEDYDKVEFEHFINSFELLK